MYFRLNSQHKTKYQKIEVRPSKSCARGSPTSDLGTGLPPSLLLLVTKQAPQDLSTGALRNNIHESNTALQPLVPSLVVLNVLLDRFGSLCVRASRRGLDDNSLGNFAGCIVGNGDDGTVCDGRVGEEVSLELGGCDLQPLFVGD
jgi:hypothetical protein